ncbi:YidH family protein [Microcoleus sp. herbarium12]|uniref:YidH family protein n=1 Tax=Microcoleus sp. herbarium12 TaxID=3055437 RepID=UPI002FD01CFD
MTKNISKSAIALGFLFKPMTVDREKLKQQNLSRAIDRSANERTFLSWMRSAIALMGFGVLIVRFRVVQIPIQHRHGTGWKLGLVFSLVGLATVLISTRKYFIVRRQIDENTYEPSDRLIFLFSSAVGLLGMGVIFCIFAAAVSPSSFVIPD